MSLRRIFRTGDAITDLDGIWDYIARDNPSAADRVIDELAERFELLLKNPEIGERQPLLADGDYRRSTCRNYAVYYRGTWQIRMDSCLFDRTVEFAMPPLPIGDIRAAIR